MPAASFSVASPPTLLSNLPQFRSYHNPSFKKKKKPEMGYLFYFWLHCVLITARGLSLVAVIGGYSLVAVCRLFIAVASLVASPGL